MSKATREINRITTAIIRISMKLIVYALIILLPVSYTHLDVYKRQILPLIVQMRALKVNS